jgi:protein ImuB
MSQLFARLEGRGRFAQKIQVTLYFEYSQKSSKVSIEPISSSRDLGLFYDLFKNKLGQLSLENPVREFEIDLIDVPEKIEQLDFFEPRDHTKDKWQRLLSFAKDHDCEVGFLETDPQLLPENSVRFSHKLPVLEKITDQKSVMAEALQIKTAFSKNLSQAPRPSLLLEHPEPLESYHQLKFLTRLPTERFETSWWQLSEKEKVCRDYYFALNSQGQLLWVFQDRMSEKYYLHGYFD